MVTQHLHLCVEIKKADFATQYETYAHEIHIIKKSNHVIMNMYINFVIASKFMEI